MAKVFIATPTHSGDVCWEFCVSLLNATEDLRAYGHAAQVMFWPGCCYVALSRNVLTSLFMESDCTDLLFIDADMRFPADGIRKLIEMPGDIVGGVYPFKVDKVGFPINQFTFTQPRYSNGLIEVNALPTGFMRIKRNVIQGMIDKHPERKCQPKPRDGEKTLAYWNLFSCEQEGSEWYGEDIFFCMLAKRAGYRCWVYPDLEFSHIGRKAWTANYGDYVGGHRA